MAKKNTSTAVAQLALGAIVGFGTEGTFAHPDELRDLLAAGHAEVNETIKQNDKVAVRATQAGIDAFNATQTEGGATAQVPGADAVAANGFEIEDGIEVPQGPTGGGRPDKYPFDALSVNQSFFVANSADKPDAVKSMQSTVATAERRYAEVDPTGKTRKNNKGAEVPALIKNRKFKIAPAEKNGVKGARVWRIK